MIELTVLLVKFAVIFFCTSKGTVQNLVKNSVSLFFSRKLIIILSLNSWVVFLNERRKFAETVK